MPGFHTSAGGAVKRSHIRVGSAIAMARSRVCMLALLAAAVTFDATVNASAGELPAGECQPEALDHSLDAQAHGLPALGVLVVHRGEIVCESYSGEAFNGVLGPQSKWHLGSNTKSMTATLIARLVDAGNLRWDATLDDLLTPHGYTVPKSSAQITLFDLVTNRSWLPQNVTDRAVWMRLYLDREMEPIEQRRQLTEWALSVEPEATTRADRYSNVGFSIAGHIAELTAGEPYETLLKRMVFEPLGITTAGFGPPQGDDDPQGHSGAEPAGRDKFADNPSAIAPAATAHMSLRDWSRYLRAHAIESDLLTKESWRTLHTPPGDGSPYAAGWMTRMPQTGDTPVLWHNGSNTMWYAEGWVLPEHDLVVMVVTNTTAGNAMQVVTNIAVEQINARLAADRQDAEEDDAPADASVDSEPPSSIR